MLLDRCQRVSCYWTWQVTSRSKDQDGSGTVMATPQKYVKTVMTKTCQLEWVCEHSLSKWDWTLCSMCSWAQLKIVALLILVGSKRQFDMGYNTWLLTEALGFLWYPFKKLKCIFSTTMKIDTQKIAKRHWIQAWNFQGKIKMNI